MIDFFKSKLRKDILALYFSDPKGDYYIREIERLLGRPAAYIRRELIGLEKKGLLVSEFRGKERFFCLNSQYPLYKQVEEIVLKTIGAPMLLGKVFENFSNIEVAFIYGTFAIKQSDLASEVDLMIIGKPNLNKLAQEIKKVKQKTGRTIYYQVYSAEDFDKGAKLRDSVIKIALASEKIYLKGLEIIR